jgi:hypothetical protein
MKPSLGRVAAISATCGERRPIPALPFRAGRCAVTIAIPPVAMLNEAAVMPRLLRLLAVLVPAPAEIIAVDGGSQDETVALVRASGFVRAVEHPVRGRVAAAWPTEPLRDREKIGTGEPERLTGADARYDAIFAQYG